MVLRAYTKEIKIRIQGHHCLHSKFEAAWDNWDPITETLKNQSQTQETNKKRGEGMTRELLYVKLL